MSSVQPVELEMNLREVRSFTITENAATQAHTSDFTFKTQFIHYDKWALTHDKQTRSWITNTNVILIA